MSQARPPVAVRRSASASAPAERASWAVLALLACVLAHEAVYQLVYPGPNAYRAAMTVMGHDGYWVGLSLAVGVTTVALVMVAVAQLRRLHREAASTPALAAEERGGLAAYLSLVGATWLRLALLATLVFTAQENLEALGAGMPMSGLDVVLGHGVLPLLVILAATLVMALAVGLVRWRRRVLLGAGRPSHGRGRAREPHGAASDRRPTPRSGTRSARGRVARRRRAWHPSPCSHDRSFALASRPDGHQGTHHA